VILLGDFNAVLPVVDNPEPGDPFLVADNDVDFEISAKNQTVTLSPFLAYAAQRKRFFHQAFAQIDVPANSSDASARISGMVSPVLTPPPTPLAPIPVGLTQDFGVQTQTLMRLNLGAGYFLYQGTGRDRIRSVSALFEMHYTTTLIDAKREEITLLEYDYLGESLPVTLTVGNIENRVDILNAGGGLAIQLAKTTIIAGVMAPLRNAPERPFDTEINFQVQRQF
jgi:hypothetical protein